MQIPLPENELNVIARAIEPNGFNLVFIKTNGHQAIYDTVVDFVKSKFPNEKIGEIKNVLEQNVSYTSFIKTFERQKEGVLFFNHFEEALNDPQFYPSLNIQRDYLAKYNISLICFVAQEDAIATCQKNIPDFFSFRTHVSEFHFVDKRAEIFKPLITFFDFRFSTIGGKTMAQKLKTCLSLLDYQSSDYFSNRNPTIKSRSDKSLILEECMLFKEAIISIDRDLTTVIDDRIRPVFEMDKIALLLKIGLVKEAEMILEKIDFKKETIYKDLICVSYMYSKSLVNFFKNDFSNAVNLINEIPSVDFEFIAEDFTILLYFEYCFLCFAGDIKKAIEIGENILIHNNINSIYREYNVHLSLINLNVRLGAFQKAREHYLLSDLIKNKLNPYNALRKEAYALLIASQGGSMEESLRQLSLGITTARRVFEPEHPFVGKFYYSRAQIYYLYGDITRCIYSLKKARKIFEGYYGNEHVLYTTVTEVMEKISSENVTQSPR
jgi:tetratricopeptide (TPR) repeat protein